MIKKLLCTLLIAVFAIGSINAQFGDVSGGSPAIVIATTSSAPPTNVTTTNDDTDFGIVPLNGTSQHTFTFTSAIAGGLALSLQNISGPDAAEFTQNSPSPATISGIGATSTFTVNFNPTSSGVKTAIIELRVVEPPFFGAIESYFFEITGEAPPPAPSIKVLGDDTLEITNGAPSNPGENTHFGSAIANYDIVTRQYTIENDGTADLVINNISNAFGSSDFSVDLTGISFPLTIEPGNSVNFNIVFSPTSPPGPTPPTVEIAAFIFIDADIDDFDFSYEVKGIGTPSIPDIEVRGNSYIIADGDVSPSFLDHTNFGDVDINLAGGASRTYTITNIGTKPLQLTNITNIVNITDADAAHFSVTNLPTTPLAPGASSTFTIRFDPSTTGTKVATVVIDNNASAAGKKPYNFRITGNATDPTAGGAPLMISQYYHGGGNNQWIEIKNISSSATTAGAYNLCLYTDTNTNLGFIENNAPDESEPIPSIPAGGVILFRNLSAVLPAAGNRGPAPVIPTLAASFTGKDVVLISTTVTADSYDNRVDIVGVTNPSTGSPPNWGANMSIIKGCGNTQLPSTTFDINDFISLELDEVRNAEPSQNVALGTQNQGTSVWTTSWVNGKTDRTRSTIISGTYTANNGSFSACNLTVEGNLDFNSNTSNYVEVSNSLTINGTFSIGDQESLYSVDASNPGGNTVTISGVITKYETTTLLNDVNDYTYWSSPVKNQNISSVFAPGAYNQGRIYYWNQGLANDIPFGGSEALGEWIAAAGQTMKVGKGYISQGPLAGTYPQIATVAFTGEPHNGTVKSPQMEGVVYNANSNLNDDLNLVGNPYPSAIDAEAFITDGLNSKAILGTIWYWTHSTANNQSTTGEQYTHDDYAVYNLTGPVGPLPVTSPEPGRYIGSGQGFMVIAKSNTHKEINFTDEMRVKGLNTQFYRGTDTKNKQANPNERDRVWLSAKSSIGGAKSEILIGFIDKATDGYDDAYDGFRLNEGWVNLYSKIDTSKFAIQGLGSFNIDKKVNLAFDSYIEDIDVTYTIGIDRFEGASLTENDLYLVDHELNVTHDLKQGDYTFEASTGFHDDRFTIQFTKATLGVDDLEVVTDFVIVNEDNALLVKSKAVVSELKMYDITGRLLVNMLPNESEFRINTHSIRKGTVLILNTTFENGTQISKKAIKY